eukprot:4605049-Heterocapsa_arctica.AAC.1
MADSAKVWGRDRILSAIAGTGLTPSALWTLPFSRIVLLLRPFPSRPGLPRISGMNARRLARTHFLRVTVL